MRPLIRAVWQAITPGIMHTVISGRPSTRETWQKPLPFFVFSSDELLKNFISCIWRFSLIPCQRNNLLAAPVKGDGEEHRLSVCFLNSRAEELPPTTIFLHKDVQIGRLCESVCVCVRRISRCHRSCAARLAPRVSFVRRGSRADGRRRTVLPCCSTM